MKCRRAPQTCPESCVPLLQCSSSVCLETSLPLRLGRSPTCPPSWLSIHKVTARKHTDGTPNHVKTNCKNDILHRRPQKAKDYSVTMISFLTEYHGAKTHLAVVII